LTATSTFLGLLSLTQSSDGFGIEAQLLQGEVGALSYLRMSFIGSLDVHTVIGDISARKSAGWDFTSRQRSLRYLRPVSSMVRDMNCWERHFLE
jgi:hypothetical protein